MPVTAPVWETHSVVEGDECSVTTLPCRLSCCSLGEDGSESLISSISSCADCDLVFFLLNACLKELRSCKTQRNKKQSVNAVSDTGVMLFLRIKKRGLWWLYALPIRKSRRTASKQWPLFFCLGGGAKSRAVS